MVPWHLHRAACHDVRLPVAVFPELNRSRTAKRFGDDVVIPLLQKGDRIRLKDGTRLFYGEGFDSESEPEVGGVPAESTEPAPAQDGSRHVEMRDDSDEQEQVRKLRERGSHASAPVTPPKARPPKKGGRNKAPSSLGPEHTFARPPSGPRHRGAGRWCRVYRWRGLDRRRPAGC